MTHQHLELFSCAGGSALGYANAGFEVTCVDLEPQPRNPFRFVQADAIGYVLEFGHRFDSVGASPPCQKHSPLNAYNKKTYPDLIGPTRDALLRVGVPFVIENVEAARAELRSPIRLCGSNFGLNMERHRLFEAGNGLVLPSMSCGTHQLCTRNGYLPTADRPWMSIHGGKHSRAWQRRACEEMGLPHLIAGPGPDALRVGVREICEAIPPAYTAWIGQRIRRSR